MKDFFGLLSSQENGFSTRAGIMGLSEIARSLLTSRIDRVTDSNLVQWNDLLLRVLNEAAVHARTSGVQLVVYLLDVH